MNLPARFDQVERFKESLPYANHRPSIVSSTSNRYALKTITPLLLLLPNSETNFILPPPKKVKSLLPVISRSCCAAWKLVHPYTVPRGNPKNHSKIMRASTAIEPSRRAKMGLRSISLTSGVLAASSETLSRMSSNALMLTGSEPRYPSSGSSQFSLFSRPFKKLSPSWFP